MPSDTGLFLRFARTFALCALGFLVAAPFVSAAAGHVAATVAYLPRYLALALALCALPAGIAASTELGWNALPRVPQVAALIGGAAVTGIVSFALSSQLSPLALRAIAPLPPPGSLPDPVRMTIPELLHELPRIFGASAQSSSAHPQDGPNMSGATVAYGNQLSWELNHRVAVAALPAVLAVLGALIGLWTRDTRDPSLRMPQWCGASLLSVALVYHGVERGFETAVTAPRLLLFPGWEEVMGPPLLALLVLGWVSVIRWMRR